MTILITGGTGKVAKHITQILQTNRVSHRIASRHSNDCRFVWEDRNTWDAALNNATTAYLIPPPTGGDASATMIEFAEHAMASGVRRFVLQSASLLNAGDPPAGKVHEWLRDNAAEWTVLRPSWFMQNFTEGPHGETIRKENAIYSATEQGRVPFIAAEDIAASAYAALTSATPLNNDFILTGPRTMTYDEVADVISHVTRRKITHHAISMDELSARHVARDMPLAGAQILAFMDLMIASGAEDRVTDSMKVLTGHAATDLETFAARNKSDWNAENDHDSRRPLRIHAALLWRGTGSRCRFRSYRSSSVETFPRRRCHCRRPRAFRLCLNRNHHRHAGRHALLHLCQIHERREGRRWS